MCDTRKVEDDETGQVKYKHCEVRYHIVKPKHPVNHIMTQVVLNPRYDYEAYIPKVPGQYVVVPKENYVILNATPNSPFPHVFEKKRRAYDLYFAQRNATSESKIPCDCQYFCYPKHFAYPHSKNCTRRHGAPEAVVEEKGKGGRNTKTKTATSGTTTTTPPKSSPNPSRGTKRKTSSPVAAATTTAVTAEASAKKRRRVGTESTKNDDNGDDNVVIRASTSKKRRGGKTLPKLPTLKDLAPSPKKPQGDVDLKGLATTLSLQKAKKVQELKDLNVSEQQKNRDDGNTSNNEEGRVDPTNLQDCGDGFDYLLGDPFCCGLDSPSWDDIHSPFGSEHDQNFSNAVGLDYSADPYFDNVLSTTTTVAATNTSNLLFDYEEKEEEEEADHSSSKKRKERGEDNTAEPRGVAAKRTETTAMVARSYGKAPRKFYNADVSSLAPKPDDTTTTTTTTVTTAAAAATAAEVTSSTSRKGNHLVTTTNDGDTSSSSDSYPTAEFDVTQITDMIHASVKQAMSETYALMFSQMLEHFEVLANKNKEIMLPMILFLQNIAEKNQETVVTNAEILAGLCGTMRSVEIKNNDGGNNNKQSEVVETTTAATTTKATPTMGTATLTPPSSPTPQPTVEFEITTPNRAPGTGGKNIAALQKFYLQGEEEGNNTTVVQSNVASTTAATTTAAATTVTEVNTSATMSPNKEVAHGTPSAGQRRPIQRTSHPTPAPFSTTTTPPPVAFLPVSPSTTTNNRDMPSLEAMAPPPPTSPMTVSNNNNSPPPTIYVTPPPTTTVRTVDNNNNNSNNNCQNLNQYEILKVLGTVSPVQPVAPPQQVYYSSNNLYNLGSGNCW